MVDLSKGPIALCTVRVHGRSETIWITDPPDGSPPLLLSVRRDRLAEAVAQAEREGGDPEVIAADRQILKALDDFIALHGDLFAEDGTPLLPLSSDDPARRGP